MNPCFSWHLYEIIKPLAARLGLPYRIFNLDDTLALHTKLKEVSAVMHGAGPFPYTAGQMATACLYTGTNYLDINGDMAVFVLK